MNKQEETNHKSAKTPNPIDLKERYAKYSNAELKSQIESMIKKSNGNQQYTADNIYKIIIFLNTEIKYIHLMKYENTDNDDWEDSEIVNDIFIKFCTVRQKCSDDFFNLLKINTKHLEEAIRNVEPDKLRRELTNFSAELTKFSNKKINAFWSYISFLCLLVGGIMGFIFFPVVFLVTSFFAFQNFSPETDKSRLNLFFTNLMNFPLYIFLGPLTVCRAINKQPFFRSITETTSDSILADFYLSEIKGSA